MMPVPAGPHAASPCRRRSALHVVVQRPAIAQRDADQAALGRFGRLADRSSGTSRAPAGAVADLATLVADDDDRREGETPTALHHLGHAVDGDQLVGQSFSSRSRSRPRRAGTAGTTGERAIFQTPDQNDRPPSRRVIASACDAAVEHVAAAVEDDFRRLPCQARSAISLPTSVAAASCRRRS